MRAASYLHPIMMSLLVYVNRCHLKILIEFERGCFKGAVSFVKLSLISVVTDVFAMTWSYIINTLFTGDILIAFAETICDSAVRRRINRTLHVILKIFYCKQFHLPTYSNASHSG
jgi:hypothetical protein